MLWKVTSSTPLVLLVIVISWLGGALGDCEAYNNNIFCQSHATNCITCSAGGGDENHLPCAGVRLKLFSTDDDFCGWCPDTCVPYIEEGDRCWQTISGTQVHGMCGPWLTCQKKLGDLVPTCAKMSTDCLDAQAVYDQLLDTGDLGMDQRRPVCDNDGLWGPVQCTGADVCRCVNKKTGHPIHGIETNMTQAVDVMNCACAREAEDLKEMGCGMRVKYDGPSSRSLERFEAEYTKCMDSRQSYFPGHLRCLPNGNYDPAQCIAQTTDTPNNPSYALENCFCYDGKQVNSSVAPINIAHIVLDCHNVDDMHFEGFYRPCEKKVVELRKLEAEHKAVGATYISTEWLEDCDIDGFFSQVQKNPEDKTLTEGFCADKFGKPLEDFKGKFDTMDCECAVVRNLTSEWGEKPTCTVDGSYRNYQCKGGKCYCVDRYGRQCDKEEDQSVTLDCLAAQDPDVPEKAPELCPASVKYVLK